MGVSWRPLFLPQSETLSTSGRRACSSAHPQLPQPLGGLEQHVNGHVGLVSDLTIAAGAPTLASGYGQVVSPHGPAAR